ncbi:MAG: Peptidoglycan-binding domain 1 [Hyphomicrobiales bacterium]|nr:Peptidoglycan-binding domain 1 [Hyphomicrobiales bacterium]
MTATVFTQLPLAAGSAVASSLGRGGAWALGHFMRAPLRYTGILALLGLSLAGASNALYFQTHRHPAPMFAPAPAAVAPVKAPAAAAPVRPATRRKPQSISSIVSGDTTGSLPAQAQQPAAGPMGNADVFALQQKLQAFRLFNGAPDGYYGPKTANAIRAFEQQAGMKPQGALSKEVAAAIMQAQLPAPQPVPQPMPQVAELQAPEPVPDSQPVQALAQEQQPQPQPPVQVADAQLPPPPAPMLMQEQQPAPLALDTPQPVQVQPQPANARPQLVGRVASADSNFPDQVLNAAADTAAGAFDAVSSMVSDVASTRGTSTQAQNRVPARPVTHPEIPPAAVASVTPAPAPVAVATPAAPVSPPVIFAPNTSPTDVALVTKVQRGLSSLGFLAGTIDGVAGESTAKAIRNFEVYYNYKETGRVSPQLLTLLQQAGAVI